MKKLKLFALSSCSPNGFTGAANAETAYWLLMIS